MSANAFFAQSQRFSVGVNLIKSLDISKFVLLIQRIAKKIHLKDEQPFNEQELKRLQQVFGITEADLQLVMDSSRYVFEQATYFLASSVRLGKELEAVGFDKEQIQAFQQVWESERDFIFEKLRARTITPEVTNTVGWRLHLKLAQTGAGSLKQPIALFELGNQNVDTDKMERLQVEFNHEELYDFFNKLESIQEQLDQLG